MNSRTDDIRAGRKATRDLTGGHLVGSATYPRATVPHVTRTTRNPTCILRCGTTGDSTP